MENVKIGSISIGDELPLAVFCGPCVIESEAMAMSSAWELKALFQKHGLPFIYKSSYDKANRSSFRSFRGPGIREGLRILKRVKEECHVPIVTDIHTVEEAKMAAEVCDVLQIPAFLCRQTDLIVAAAETGAVVKVKKGQFMSPGDMKNVVEKILETGNRSIILTERGSCFGYNNLVSDMRAIPLMQRFGFPVCFDASHSSQLPGGNGETSGGDRALVLLLAKAAVACGCNCLFLEAHPNPPQALSDRDTVLSFEELDTLLQIAKKLRGALCSRDSCS